MKNSLLLLFLISSVYILQSIIFADQLKYGFRDGDWWILSEYKKYEGLSLDNLINVWKKHGVYTYQVYYLGFAEKIVGLDFQKLHQVTHFFKFLATLSVFPLILIITKNKLTAFLTTLIFAVAYPTAGAMFMMVTGGYFVAIISMSVFLISYSILFNSSSPKFSNLVIGLILLILTLFLNTERMFPLVPLILIVEFFWLCRNKSSRKYTGSSLKRLAVFFVPLVLFYAVYSLWIKPSVVESRFAESFIPEASKRVKAISDGNWQLLLYPFSSFGSLFLHDSWWKLIGQLNTSNLHTFLSSFILGPFLIFFVVSTFLLRLVSKRPIKFVLITLVPVAIFGLIIFAIGENWQNINPVKRIHLDTNVVSAPALFGFYILSLSFSFFLIWLKEKDEYKKLLLLPLFLGTAVSFLFIILTWIMSDVQLLFVGPQRYLTTPSIGSSLFIAALLVLIFLKLRKVAFTKNMAWISFILIVPIILMNAQIVKQFFTYELQFAGMEGIEQTHMKNKFWSLVPNMSQTEPSLFYFDESQDYENGYSNESTILAGFEDWTKFSPSGGVIINRPQPGMIRSNVQCPLHTHEDCINILKEGLMEQEGLTVILYKDSIRENLGERFFKISNFYAFRFRDKQLIDISREVLKEMKE